MAVLGCSKPNANIPTGGLFFKGNGNFLNSKRLFARRDCSRKLGPNAVALVGSVQSRPCAMTSRASTGGNDEMKGKEISGESELLFQSLPKRELFGTALYQFQQFWFSPERLQEVTLIRRHFEASDGDILLATHPKVGTTWIKALVFAIVNRSRHTLASHPLLTTNPHILVPFLEMQLFANNQVSDLSTLYPSRVFATHIPCTLLPESVKDSNNRIVYLCRNPKDTFVSLWHFANSLLGEHMASGSFKDAFDLFCEGVVPFGPYWDHALEYWKLSLEKPEKVLFIKYEDMKQDPNGHLVKLAEFLGYPFPLKQEENGTAEEISRLCSFENLRNLDVNKTGKILPDETAARNNVYFRKGKVGDWENHLTQEMIERIDSITREKFAGSGLMM